MSKLVLITDELHSLLQEGLEASGYTVHYRPDILPNEVADIIHLYTGIIINSKIYAGQQLLGKAPLLQFVARAGSGLEVIDLPYAASRNIAVINSPEGNRNAVAEHGLGMLLTLMNNIVPANEQVKKGDWLREPNRGTELSGKTVGLLAFGNTAQAFAKLLSGFDVKILAYDKYLKGFGNAQVQESSLEQIFEAADVLSIHLPLTNETAGWLDERFLTSFKKPIWLLNTSRGKVLNTAHLLNAIEQGRVVAAALDVLENEKLRSFTDPEKQLFNRLVQEKRVLLTPHIAGWTHESKVKIARVLLEKITALGML